jgi:hypothetical protein
MPFRYGIATLTEMPHAFVRLEVESGGRVWTGIAADSLPPKWFTKDPAEPFSEEIESMLEGIDHAVHCALDEEATTPFDLWLEVQEAQCTWARNKNLPPLLAQFGVSLVERALLEAACHAAGRPFHQLLRSDALGIRLGNFHTELGGLRPSRFLQDAPLPSVFARHTVGLADPITDADVPDAERLNDGLPQSLEACIRAYDLRHFKIKLCGRSGEDQPRLRLLASIIQSRANGDVVLTLDGNECFRSMAAFREYWEGLSTDDSLRPFLGCMLFAEQPLHRSCALADEVGATLKDWIGHPPMIIDESDDSLGSVRRAIELGYAGTSHKNCKGVFKSVAYACLAASRRAEGRLPPLLLSGEDLCNVGPIALLQDLAVASALGIGSVERNGHHYIAGLSQFPSAIQDLTLAAHPDLYRRAEPGWPTAIIRGGKMHLDTVNAAPFGVGCRIPVEGFTPATEWRW